MSFLFNKNKKEKEAAKAAAAAAAAANSNKAQTNGAAKEKEEAPQGSPGRSNRNEGGSSSTGHMSQNEPQTPPRAQRQPSAGPARPPPPQPTLLQGRGPVASEYGMRNASSSTTASGIPEPGRYRDISGASTNDVFSSNAGGRRLYPDTGEEHARTASNGSSANASNRAPSPAVEKDSPRSRQARKMDQGQTRGALPTPSSRSQGLAFPWTRRLLHQSPSLLNSFGTRSPKALHDPDNATKLPKVGELGDRPPFPRYGAAAASNMPPIPTNMLPNLATGKDIPPAHSYPSGGEIWMFGGLVGNEQTDETFLLSFPYQPVKRSSNHNKKGSEKTDNEISITYVETTGEKPSPRIGHAACFIQSYAANRPGDGPKDNTSRDGIFVVWGGDTRTREDEALDGDLYLLNTTTRHWHRIRLSHSSSGRYGHSIAHLGNKIVAWGGQDSDYLFDEMVTFDLGHLKTHNFAWEGIQYATVPPSRRSGHISAVHNGKLYISCGLTAEGCVNDTWVYEPETRVWTELTTVGHVPSPCEGASSAIVGDVIYVFGGRTAQSEELRELWGFRIANQRWYVFEKMGEAPAARSGHSLASIAGKIFVLGGEAFNPKVYLDAQGNAMPFEADDDKRVSVLETLNIRFSPAAAPPLNAKPKMLSIEQSDEIRQDELTPKLPSYATFQPTISPEPPHNQDQIMKAERLERAQAVHEHRPASTHEINQDSEILQAGRGDVNSRNIKATPIQTQIQPKGDARGPAQEPDASATAPSSPRSVRYSADLRPNAGQSKRPAQNGEAVIDSDVEESRFINNRESVFSESASSQVEQTPPRTGTALSSRRTQGVLSPPPSDAFYYSSEPSQPTEYHDDGLESSTLPTSHGDNDPIHTERTTRAMRAELQMLRQSRHLSKPSPELNQAPSDEHVDQQQVIGMILDLRKELESARLDLHESRVVAHQRIGDAMRGRAAALQEAAALKSKLVSFTSDLPNHSPLKASEMQLHEMESRLGKALRERTAAVSQLKLVQDELTADRRDKEDLQTQVQAIGDQLAQCLEERESLLVKVTDLQERHSKASSTAREQQAQCVDLGRQMDNHRAESLRLNARIQGLIQQNDGLTKTIAQSSTAYEASQSHALRAESMYDDTRQELDEKIAELGELNRIVLDQKAQLSSMAGQVDISQSHANDLKALLDQVREENQALKGLTQGNLSEFLDSHRQTQAQQSREISAQSLTSDAVQNELLSLRALHSESQESVRSLETEVAQLHVQLRDRETKHSKVRVMLSESQAQLAQTQTALSRSQRQYSDREAEIQDHIQGLEASEIRAGLLKSVVQENGLLMTSRSATPAEGHHSNNGSIDLQDKFAKTEHQYAAIQAAQRSRSVSIAQRSVSKTSMAGVDVQSAPSAAEAESSDRDIEKQATIKRLISERDEAKRSMDQLRHNMTRLEQEANVLRREASAGTDQQLRTQLDLAQAQLQAERSTKQQYLTSINEQYAQRVKILERQNQALQKQAMAGEDVASTTEPNMSSTNLSDNARLYSRRAGLETRHRRYPSSEASLDGKGIY